MPYQIKSHILCRILICALCGIKNQKCGDLNGPGEAEKLVAMIKMYSNPDYDEKMLLEFAQLAVRKYFIRLMNLNINKTFSHKNVHLRNKYVLYISSYLWIGKR